MEIELHVESLMDRSIDVFKSQMDFADLWKSFTAFNVSIRGLQLLSFGLWKESPPRKRA